MHREKRGSCFAVGIAIRDCIESVILDQQRILPVIRFKTVSAMVFATWRSFGPHRRGRGGAKSRIEIDLWPKELQGLSAPRGLSRTDLGGVLKRIG